MKHSTTWKRVFGVGAIALIGVAGCADRNKNDVPESPATAPEISNATDKAVDATGNAVDAAGNAISNTAEKVPDAMKNLDDAAVITPKVKTALGANASLKGSTINVDTTDQGVTLSGSVKNEAQKKVAGDIAKKNAPNYKIMNNLTVTGGKPATASH